MKMSKRTAITRRQWMIDTTLAFGVGVGMSVPATAGAGLSDDLLSMVGHGKPALRLLLLDVSASPDAGDPRKLYRETALAFLAATRPGDEVVVAKLGDHGMDRFVAETINVRRTGRKFDDRKLLHAAQQRAAQEVDRVLALPPTRQSRLIETLAAAQPLVQSALERGAPVRVALATDAIEDSAQANFSAPGFTQVKADELLQKLVQAKRLMALPPANAEVRPDIEVAMAGAGGNTPEAWQRNQRFWAGYFKACAARLAFYGRTVPQFG